MPAAISSPVGERDARGAAVPLGDRGDLRPGPDLAAEAADGAGQGVGQGAGAPARERRLPGRPAVVAGGVEQEYRRRPRRPGSDRRVLHPAGGEHAAERVGLERLTDQVGHRHRQRAERLAARLRAHPLERAPQLQAHHHVGDRRRLDVRRGADGEVREEARERTDPLVEHRVRRGVGGGPVGQALCGALDVGPERHRAAVGLRRERPDLGADQVQAVPVQLEVADDRAPKPPDGVRDGGNADTGRQLGADRGAADRLGSFQHERLQARLRQVPGGDQAVVPGPDHDRVERPAAAAARRRAHAARPFRSFRTSSAARRPFAPMIPPPGCVGRTVHATGSGPGSGIAPSRGPAG